MNEFTAFPGLVILFSVFEARSRELEDYYETNRKRVDQKLHLFYVWQGGKLQCQNGAYFTDVVAQLLAVLFGTDGEPGRLGGGEVLVSFQTGTQISTV